jgi:hypothetical protein
MGEYMAADDGPRETILRNMKFERLAPTLIYRHVRRAVSAFLASPTRDRSILLRCRMLLENERDSASLPQQRENIIFALRALETFERSLNALGLDGLNFENAPAARPLRIEGVSVSVQPTAHIRVKRMRGADLVGAIVVDLAKGIEAKTEESKSRTTAGMVHAAALLHQYVTNTLAREDARPSSDHCVIFHSYRRERVSSPSNYRRKLRNVEAVCRVIARGWNDIVPPPSFDPNFATYRN